MVATISTQTITAPIYNASTVASAINTALNTAGFTNVDSWTITSTSGQVGNSGDGSPYWVTGNPSYGICVKYQYNTMTKGTVYLAVLVYGQTASSASYGLACAIFDSWSTSTHSSPTGYYSPWYYNSNLLNLNYPITLSIINGTEYKGIFFQQYEWSSNNFPILVFRPSVQPSWWTSNNLDNTYLYAFLAVPGAYLNPINCNWYFVNYSSNQPWGVSSANSSTASPLFQIYNSAGACSFQYFNPNNLNLPDLQIGLYFLQPTGGYAAGWIGYSTEIAMLPGIGGNSSSNSSSLQYGSTITTTVSGSTQVYTVIYCPTPGNTTQPACAIRTS